MKYTKDKHIIEAPQTIGEQYWAYINNVTKRASKYDISVQVLNVRSIGSSAGTNCNGYFSDVDKHLVVACDQPLDHWFKIFIHESCHMDQWIEQCSAWTEWADFTIADIHVSELLHMWLSKQIELKQSIVEKIITACLNVELDCERRSLQKIVDYNILLNKKQYIQQANAYIYFYRLLLETRKWYDIGHEPYNNTTIVANMPDTFDNDYTILPKQIKQLMVSELG